MPVDGLDGLYKQVLAMARNPFALTNPSGFSDDPSPFLPRSHF